MVGVKILVEALQYVFQRVPPKSLPGLEEWTPMQQAWLSMANLFCFAGPFEDPEHGNPTYRVNGIFPYFQSFVANFNCFPKADMCPIV